MKSNGGRFITTEDKDPNVCNSLLQSYPRQETDFCGSQDVIADIKYIDEHEHMGEMYFCAHCLENLRRVCAWPFTDLVCIPCRDLKELGHTCYFRVEIHFRDGSPMEVFKDPTKSRNLYESVSALAKDYALPLPEQPQTWKAIGRREDADLFGPRTIDTQAWKEIARRSLRDVQERYDHQASTRAEVRPEEGTQ